ncbi:MAG: FCD domain-containing protein [Planctomycetes bacterium]|nr:FCD domain-containing protein [Planctomycetota bacterium]
MLPNQSEFAAQLGVSRLSLREGLHTLQMIGVVEQRPKIGTRILNDHPDSWLHKLNVPLLADKRATIELLQARSVLEIQMARLVAANATKSDIRIVESSIDAMEKCIKADDLEGYLHADVDFHKKIGASCHNRYLVDMLYSVMDILEEFMREVFREIPSLLPDSMEKHRNIFNALKNADDKNLVRHMTDHLSHIEKHTLKFIDA